MAGNPAFRRMEHAENPGSPYEVRLVDGKAPQNTDGNTHFTMVQVQSIHQFDFEHTRRKPEPGGISGHPQAAAPWDRRLKVMPASRGQRRPVSPTLRPSSRFDSGTLAPHPRTRPPVQASIGSGRAGAGVNQINGGDL